MAIDPERLTSRAVYVRGQVAALRAMLDVTDAATFAVHPFMPSAARYRLQTAIEALIDIAYHVCAKKLQYAPENAQDALTRLEAAGILPHDAADRRRDMVRFRNRVVHGYLDVDDARLFRFLPAALDDIGQTLACLEAVGASAET